MGWCTEAHFVAKKFRFWGFEALWFWWTLTVTPLLWTVVPAWAVLFPTLLHLLLPTILHSFVQMWWTEWKDESNCGVESSTVPSVLHSFICPAVIPFSTWHTIPHWKYSSWWTKRLDGGLGINRSERRSQELLVVPEASLLLLAVCTLQSTCPVSCQPAAHQRPCSGRITMTKL